MVIHPARNRPTRGNPLPRRGTIVVRRRGTLTSASAFVTLAVTQLVGAGCITIYHPLTSLQRPTVIDPTLRNFDGLRLEVRCFSGGALDDKSADRLCSRVEQLFANQGAEVSIWSERGGRVCDRLGIGAGHVSLTDDGGLVIAFAVVEAAT